MADRGAVGTAGPAELHYLGALLWRRATAAVLGGWVEPGERSAADAIRVAGMIGALNMRRCTGSRDRACPAAAPAQARRSRTAG